ncbi:hypothetical protein V6N12_053063 [Hibiscus sabdariffa]|uniref:Sulfotransferase n=1 Tax=Hibiscus sabdariffa TaxID=183260 RepID=A0ABR2AX94_9ROSI
MQKKTAETSENKLGSPTQDVDNWSWDDEFHQLVQTLPREQAWFSATANGSVYLYQGFWFTARFLKPVISFQRHFQAFGSDVMVASFPKCGTTWLKALTFSILYRSKFARGEIEHTLLNSTPHQLVPFLEFDVYRNNPSPDLENICVYKPGLFATHVPRACLPTSIGDSKSIVRNFLKNCCSIYVSREKVLIPEPDRRFSWRKLVSRDESKVFQHPKAFSSEFYLVEVLWDLNVCPDFTISLRTGHPVDDSPYSDFGVMRYLLLGKITMVVSLVAKWGKAGLKTWPLVELYLHIPLLKLWDDCPVEGDEDLRAKLQFSPKGSNFQVLDAMANSERNNLTDGWVKEAGEDKFVFFYWTIGPLTVGYCSNKWVFTSAPENPYFRGYCFKEHLIVEISFYLSLPSLGIGKPGGWSF